MKISQVLMVVATLVTMHSMYAAPSLGQDVVYGMGTGVASLGVFYGTQGDYFQLAEGKALFAATLVGVVLPAFLQAANNGSDLSNYLATLVAAALTFGAGKYLYENQESLLAQLQGSNPGVAAQANSSAQMSTTTGS